MKNENPAKLDSIFPVFDPFQVQCSLISAINKRFKGSDYSDILVAADVIEEGSVEQELRGKHYKRSIRRLRLMHGVLHPK